MKQLVDRFLSLVLMIIPIPVFGASPHLKVIIQLMDLSCTCHSHV